MARTEITRAINKYIRDNGLQDIKNKRNINPDEKLSMLFKLTPMMNLHILIFKGIYLRIVIIKIYN
jgi:chromatin remodeling complex protein RSC6